MLQFLMINEPCTAETDIGLYSAAVYLAMGEIAEPGVIVLRCPLRIIVARSYDVCKRQNRFPLALAQRPAFCKSGINDVAAKPLLYVKARYTGIVDDDKGKRVFPLFAGKPRLESAVSGRIVYFYSPGALYFSGADTYTVSAAISGQNDFFTRNLLIIQLIPDKGALMQNTGDQRQGAFFQQPYLLGKNIDGNERIVITGSVREMRKKYCPHDNYRNGFAISHF